MKRLLRFLGFGLLCLLGLLAVVGALFGYFVYSPDPELPQLSGKLSEATIEVDGFKRTYLTYVPQRLAKGSPLVVVMHGSGQNGAQIRLETGYGFDRLADQHGFAVVYPSSHSFDWNDCSQVGSFVVNGRKVDDLGFLGTMVDQLVADIGIDRSRVFATGVSAGGFMSIRLALEAPARFRAVAAVAANVPTPENFKCRPMGPGTSVMFMNGSQDPLVPFAGGEVNLLGLFFKGGKVRSSRESAQYFADLNQLADPPTTTQSPMIDGGGGRDGVGVGVEQLRWHNASKVEVELVAIHGGGHGLPQPHYRRPRLLGPSPMTPDGPAMIWAFFERQRP